MIDDVLPERSELIPTQNFGDAGRFSFSRFYERRVRRIFPALFAMLALVSAAAFVLLFPADLVRYAQSLLATALFVLEPGPKMMLPRSDCRLPSAKK